MDADHPNAAFGRNQEGIPDSKFQISEALDLESGIGYLEFQKMRARRRDSTERL
jgi:hypothetical protein